MPQKSKKSRSGRANFQKRRDILTLNDENNNTDEIIDQSYDGYMSITQQNESLDTNYTVNNDQNVFDANNKCCQTDIKQYCDIGTQTICYNESLTISSIEKYFSLFNIRDLIDILIDLCKNFHSVHLRILSCIIYLLLWHVKVKFQDCRKILDELNLLSIQR